ncbi:MAG: hypothetical protein KC776_18455 [Myxococcales bacterium]|nr:hypothetical protein [Myxococcales bacterium]MCB9579275.1 hypothetical protein [Polyangiaceae bacterium]
MVNWRRWFRPAPALPFALRVSDAHGRPVKRVDLEGQWLPSGRPFRATPIVADGLCVIPWSGDDRVLQVQVRSGAGSGELTVERDREEPHRALGVRLREEAAVSLSS